MNVGVAHSEVNPNTRVMNSRGIWLAYVLLVALLHVVLLSIPFFSIPVVWTLTNVIHNLVSAPRGAFSDSGRERRTGFGDLVAASGRRGRPLALKSCSLPPLSLLPGHVCVPAHGERDTF